MKPSSEQAPLTFTVRRLPFTSTVPRCQAELRTEN